MAENAEVKERRRAKFLEKMEKKNNTTNFKVTGNSDVHPKKENNYENISTFTDPNSGYVIKTERVKIHTQENIEDKNYSINNENTLNLHKSYSADTATVSNRESKVNYKEIYKAQKLFEKLRNFQYVIRFLVFCLFGLLHYLNLSILYFSFDGTTNICTLFVIIETSFYFFNLHIEKKLKNLLTELSKDQQYQQEQIINTLSVIETVLNYIKSLITVLMDISAFLFINIVCYLLITI